MLTSFWCWQFRWLSAIFIKTWKTLKVSEALNRLLKVLIIAINAQSHSVDAPSPWFGGGDRLCPYERKLIGSLVPVHSRSVRSNTYAFLDPSLKLVAFLLNYFTCFPIHNMIVLTDVVCYGWFMEFVGRSSAGRSCEISVRDLFCFLSVFCDPGSQLSTCFTDIYLFALAAWNSVHHSRPRLSEQSYYELGSKWNSWAIRR